MHDLSAQIAFILEIDKLKAVYRKTMVEADSNRHENSAEHSWHIAMLAQIMAGYAQRKIDILRVTKMLLIHDIVEIDAGDLFAFADEQDHQAQEQKELAAAKRIFGLLPPELALEMGNLWHEFEQAQTADAQFAKGMVQKSQVLKRNHYLKDIAPKLWQYVQQEVEIAVEKGWLLDR